MTLPHDPRYVEIAVRSNGQIKFRLDIGTDLESDAVEAIDRMDSRQKKPRRQNHRKIHLHHGRLVNIVAK
jgi:hypothetical protein